MSSGTGAVQFQINKNNATQGVFFQREKPTKNETRKFGYKSKNLRHPIRQPDYEAEAERIQQEAEEEKQKYNKNKKDFIRNNRERYKPKSENAPPPGTTHIAPGTVTLTQEQLAALLQTLGKSSQGTKGKGDNPLRISIDPDSNKIEVEKYESDSNGDADSVRNNNRANSRTLRSDDGGGSEQEVSIAALLNSEAGNQNGNSRSKSHSKNDRGTAVNKAEASKSNGESRARQPQRSSGNPGRSSTRPESNGMPHGTQTGTVAATPQTRLSWDDAKKAAGVGHVPDTVPMRHLTVGEKKRLQWARERAEVAEEYNPWGKPGAGAPGLQKQAEDSRNESRAQPAPAWISRAAGDGQISQASETQKKKEELANEILKLQQEIREAEQRREREAKRNEQEENNEGKRLAEKNDGGRHVSKSKKERRQFVAERKEKEKKETKEDEIKNDSKNQEFDESNLSRKEIERRKWLAELDKQREEQRLKKQREKEQDRDGVQDHWADRFKIQTETTTKRQVQPPQIEKTPQTKVTYAEREHHQHTGRSSQAYDSVDNVPPVAMRSSIVVGDASLNENRYDNKKADDKRKWLQELEQQREEQRLAKQVEKERDRQENLGTWADSRQTDHLKLRHGVPHNHGNHIQLEENMLSKNNQEAVNVDDGRRGRTPQNYVGDAQVAQGAQRVKSAPEPDVLASQDEGSTFLRGQGVFVDPVTKREQEEKRRIHLEYQAQVKAQIEEKDRLKREERERKRREDMEEERKLQMERDQFNQQAELEQKKLRDKEEQRQKQVAQLKTAMDEAQEKALEDKTHRRLNHLKAHGHDVSQLKAAYDATPRGKEYNLSAIPGLETEQDPPPLWPKPQAVSPPAQDLVDSARFEQHRRQDQQHPQGVTRHPIGQSYTKDPYVEDRVLTPSRFRGNDQNSTKNNTNNHGSPLREFGTQTLELKELQTILNSLPEDIQIEYKLKVEDALREKERNNRQKEGNPPRKVHVKSADDLVRKKAGKGAEGKPPQVGGKKLLNKQDDQQVAKQSKGGRQGWNQPARKTVVKNSEKDPFYQQKKEQAELRRAQRERRLQYLQELNSNNIPSEKNHHMSRSRSRHEHCSPRRTENDENENKTVVRQRPDRSESPNILSLLNNERGRDVGRNNAGSKYNTKSKSPVRQQAAPSTGPRSPPIPAIKHRTAGAGGELDSERDPYVHVNKQLRVSQSDNRYGDAHVLPATEGEFVPFLRTTEILDPSKAAEPIALSREGSRMERARQAYRETRNPAGKGHKVDIYQDREREAALRQSQQSHQASNNPLLNPSLVLDHPTGRQDQILQQLSSLKQTLMQRQKELETHMTPAELEAEATRG